MPLYEYQCDACSHRFETIQKFSDPPLETCPKCAGVVRKLQSAPAFQFKGAGWYITDYAKKDGGSAEKSESKADGSSDGKAEGKTESKTESKAADGSPSKSSGTTSQSGGDSGTGTASSGTAPAASSSGTKSS